MGHHRYSITINARIEAPRTVPKDQVPTDESVTEKISQKLQGLDLGGQYTVRVDGLKYKKGAAEA